MGFFRLKALVLFFLAVAATAQYQPYQPHPPPRVPASNLPPALEIHGVPSLGAYAVDITIGTEKRRMLLDSSNTLPWVKSEDDKRDDGISCDDPMCAMAGGICDYTICQFSGGYNLGGVDIKVQGPVKRGSFNTTTAPVNDVVYVKSTDSSSSFGGSYGDNSITGSFALGRNNVFGNISIPAQKSGGRFAYCLPDIEAKMGPSFLYLGNPRPLLGMQYVPLVAPSWDYYVQVESLVFNGINLSIDPAAWDRRTKFDTLKSITELDTRVYEPLIKPLSQAIGAMNLWRVNGPLEFCYRGDASLTRGPTLSIIFAGGARMDISSMNYMVNQGSGIMCIGMKKVLGEQDPNVIGNSWQRNFHFDVQKDKIGFLKGPCVQRDLGDGP